MRLAALLAVILAAPPRGHVPPRPKATHVVLVETKLVGSDVTLEPGALVAAPGQGAATGGKVSIETVGPVDLTGRIDGGALGLFVEHDADLTTNAGKPAGKAHLGARVHVDGVKGTQALVTTAGPLKLKAAIALDALGATPTEMVFPNSDGEIVTVKNDTPLWSTEAKTGTPIGQLAHGGKLTVVDRKENAVHVTTYGDFEVDGWVNNLDLGQPAADAPLPHATHEVFVDTPLTSDQAGTKSIGTVVGGTLVAIDPKPVAGPRALVVVLGAVRIEGWIAVADLQKLTAEAP